MSKAAEPSQGPERNKNEQQGSSRQRYRDAISYRQTRLYGTIIAGLGIAVLVALLGLTGLLPLPFGSDFSKEIDYASYEQTPCPPDGAKPVSAQGAQIQVLNASSTTGLAGDVASLLESVDYEISLIDNSPESFRGNVQIEAGPEAVDQAYTIARYFESPIRIRLGKTTGQTVTVILGEGFHGLATAEEAQTIKADTSALTPLEECKPVNPKMLEDAALSREQNQSESPESGTEEKTETE